MKLFKVYCESEMRTKSVHGIPDELFYTAPNADVVQAEMKRGKRRAVRIHEMGECVALTTSVKQKGARRGRLK